MEFNVYNKCRVCLNDEEQMHNLFVEFDQGVTLRDILVNTTKFEVEENDGLSPFICQNCSTVVVDFYNLKAIYEENETQIRTLLTTSQANLMQKEDDVVEEEESEEFPVEFGENSEISSETGGDYITIKMESCNNSDNESIKEDSEDPQNFDFEEINTFTCPQCGQCYLDKNAIQSHLISQHNLTVVDFNEFSEVSYVKVNKEKPSKEKKCKICDQIFQTSESYKQHLNTHKKNVCDICGVGFIKKSYLKDHLEIHCPEKRHICTYCNKAFKRRTVLVKHRRIHTHPREHICEKCGKAFNDRGTLKTHNMLLHVRERNYMCLICGIKFPLKATLDKHIRRHQNKEREFFCSQCPLGYRDKSSLDRHIYMKHSGQNIKATCTDCGKQYTTLGNLSKHQRICHSVDGVLKQK